MKRILSAALLLFTALTLMLAGCTAPQTKISNSRKFGYLLDGSDTLYESYVYSVTAAEKTYNEKDIRYDYDIIGTGEFTVNLYDEGDGVFRLESFLEFDGKYKYSDNSYSDEFSDTVTSISRFKLTADSFIATYSEKIYNQTVPFNKSGTYVLKKMIFTVKSEYKAEGKGYKVASTVTDNKPAELPEENFISAIKRNNSSTSASLQGRFCDSDQIFMALRVQTLDTSFTDSFSVYKPLEQSIQKLSISSAKEKETKAFGSAAGETATASLPAKSYECVVVTSSVNGIYKGSDMVMYFADHPVKYLKSDGTPLESSINASVLLQFKLDNMLYSLKQYDNFASKYIQPE